MEEGATEPYLEATLEAPQAELDLSGATPFCLRITATLHAQSPILCYVPDTFLWPQTALRKAGFIFTKLDNHPQPVKRSTVSINTGNFTDRPWHLDHCLLFQPQKPITIDVPVGSLRGMGAHPLEFDVRLWITTSGFETGCSYEATLPATGMLSWWRWASVDELAAPSQGEAKDLIVDLPYGGSLSAGKNDLGDGVPVLPKDQQLRIYTSRNKVGFTCHGRPVQPSQQCR